MVENRYSRDRHKKSSNLAFALAYEIKQYVEAHAEEIDRDIWDNIQYWRSGILSQGAMTEENLSEIIKYIGADKIQELITIASSN